MILASVGLALLLMYLSSKAFAPMNTPDMRIYSAMSRGLFVPRPYSLRWLPRVMPDSMRAWKVLQAACHAAIAACVHIIAERVGVSPLPVVATVFTVHFVRLGTAIPVLLDMPILAIACLCAVLAPYLGGVIVVVVIASVLIHERAPLWCAIYASPFAEWQFLAIGVAIAGTFTLIDYKRRPKHTDEDDAPWLKDPLREAIKTHTPRVNDWNAWIRPWGLTIIGIAVGGWWMLLALGIGYAGCIMAQDRARIYGMAVVPLALSVCTLLGGYAFVVPIVNWFTTSREI